MTWVDKIRQIQELLIDAYDHYFDNSDGNCKSSEGVITVYFPNYWELKEGRSEPVAVEVYSYVLGPSRNHHFKTVDEALDAVNKWWFDEMEADYNRDW